MTGNEIRLLALEAVHRAGKGHIGGVLSCADILAAVYSVMRPEDKFLLSKGHAGVGLYAALALRGDIDTQELFSLNRGGMLGEHPSRQIPGVEINSGSLGHGLGIACGMALANKRRNSDARIYVLMGDGECWEGSVWEAAMFAAHHYLNITVIVDRNGYSVQGATEEIVGLGNLVDKFHAFQWSAVEVMENDRFLTKQMLTMNNGPRCLVVRTTKGKGVSFMEGKPEWHHGSISAEQMAQCVEELHGHA